jgi:hypothetical protein
MDETEANVSWANAKLQEAQYRSEGLRRALAGQLLSPPGSQTRAGFAEQCLAELHGIELEVRAVEELIGPNPDITNALRAIASDRARLEGLAGDADPPGVRPEMTWAEALRQWDIMGYSRLLMEEISKQARPEAANPLATLYRADGPYQAAEGFAQQELADRIDQLIDVATRFADQAGEEPMGHRYPGFDYRTADPPPEFQITVRELVQQMAPVLFPMDASYVIGDLFNMLVPVYAHATRTLGPDLGTAAVRLTLVDVLFLRGQLAVVASYAASLPRATVAREALSRTAAMLMTAASGSGPGKIPVGYHAELAALRFYVDAFMNSMLGRLAAATSN